MEKELQEEIEEEERKLQNMRNKQPEPKKK